MNSAVINIKTNPETKIQAKKVADDLGLSLSSLVNAFLKQMIKTRTVTFSARDEEPNDYLKALIKQAENDYKKSNTSPVFKKPQDFLTYLHKEAAK